MGRGLSPLQQSLLTLAYRNRRDTPEPHGGDVRVMIAHDRPTAELRALVPEAFAYPPDGYWLRPIARHNLGAEGLTLTYREYDHPMRPEDKTRPSYRYHWLIVATFNRWHNAEAEIFRDVLEERGCYAKTYWKGTGAIRDIYTAEAIHAIYGFRDYSKLPGQEPQTTPPEGFPDAMFSRCSWRWGWSDYATQDGERADTNVIAVSVSRAIKRLGERGLAKVYHAAFDLTEEGVQVAAGVLANENDNITSVNRYPEVANLRLLGLSEDEIAARMERRRAEEERQQAEFAAFMTRQQNEYRPEPTAAAEPS